MSILNLTNDGFPQVLLVLWRALCTLGPMKKDKLVALCAPASIDNDKDVGNTLRRWIQLGVFEESAHGRVTLRPPFDRLEVVDGDLEYRQFRRELRRLVFSSTCNEDYLRPEPSDASDFTFAIAWLMSTDVYSGALENIRAVQRLEDKQVVPIGSGNTKYAFQNPTRWTGFRAWASFLSLGSATSPFQLDPAEAIEEELDVVFGETRTMSIAAFRDRVAECVPILDRGVFARRARERAADGWRAIEEHEMSPAMTRALLRFEVCGTVRLEDRADADRLTMLGSSFVPLRPTTHVSWEGGTQ